MHGIEAQHVQLGAHCGQLRRKVLGWVIGSYVPHLFAGVTASFQMSLTFKPRGLARNGLTAWP